jgi:NAD(P)-dependent dehydrogenase (short-subunit alcohol dehydrogenase family)
MTPARVAIVTGANRGIGYELARQLAHSGIQVVAAARTRHAADDTATALGADGVHVHPAVIDLTNQDTIDQSVATTIARFGRIDILVNNAAIAIDTRMPAASPDLDLAHRTLETNLFGTWRMCAAVIPHMRTAGYGRILNLTTHMAVLADIKAGSPAYRISKTSINALTRILADELTGTGILINAASPGRVKTRIGPANADRTPAEAAHDLLWLTNLPATGPTGHIFYQNTELPW